jgi:hypothetical protein
MVNKVAGSNAADRIVIEEALPGRSFVLLFSDGRDYVLCLLLAITSELAKAMLDQTPEVWAAYRQFDSGHRDDARGRQQRD